MTSILALEIDGRPVSAAEAWSTAAGYGHFTAMQVRGTRARGLTLHVDRLAAANRELFDAGLDRERVRSLIRHALGEVADASVRVYCFETDAEPAVMVTARGPAGVTSPQRLRSVRYHRPDAHLKHLATGQGYHSRAARRLGFDDALLVDERGMVCEGATANIGFLEEPGVVWPDGPHLRGITMQLLQRKLPEAGIPSRTASVSVDDAKASEGAFLSSARGIAVVAAIDDAPLPEPTERIHAIADAYESVPWDPI